jgi:predicted dehydrogenase
MAPARRRAGRLVAVTARVGLLGTGHWARSVHAPGLQAHPGVELVGVWGRDPGRATTVAEAHGCRSFTNLDDLLGVVDVVAIALPPDVQAELGTRAALAGRHLLLDKPVALDPAAATRLHEATDARQVASVVFFTDRFRPEGAAWFAAQEATTWRAGAATLLASVFAPDSPYRGSPWRRTHGGLWDVGPHALSVLVPLLGPVEAVLEAATDARGTTNAVVRHRDGESRLILGLDAPAESVAWDVELEGPTGSSSMPPRTGDATSAYRAAVDALLMGLTKGASQHPCDVAFGASMVPILAAIQARAAEGT